MGGGRVGGSSSLGASPREVGRLERKSLAQLYSLALELSQGGEWGRARRVWEMLARRSPEDGRVWLAWAKMEVADGKVDRARACLSEGVQHNPDNARLFHAWAVMEERQGNIHKARTLLEKCLALDKTDGITYQTYALLEERNGDPKKASTLLNRAVEVDPMNESVWNALGMYEQRNGDLHSAAHKFQRATELNPMHCHSWQAWACVEDRLGNHETARELFQQALHVDPHSAPAYQAFALAESRAGNVDHARELFQRAIEVEPRHAAVYHAWACLEESQGQFEAARDLFERGVRANPMSAPMLRAWARMELRLGHIDDSFSDWKLGFEPHAKGYGGRSRKSREKKEELAEKLSMLRRLVERKSDKDVRLVLLWLQKQAVKDKDRHRQISEKGNTDSINVLHWAKNRSAEDVHAFQNWFDSRYKKDRRIAAYLFGWNLPTTSPVPPEWTTLDIGGLRTLSEGDEDIVRNDNPMDYGEFVYFLGSFADGLASRAALTAALSGLTAILLMVSVGAGLFDVAAPFNPDNQSVQAPSGVDAHLVELHDSDESANFVTIER
uniref:Suppressor of forked domain-containing protein n=1 Tax=Compsopogon caeruleus TaxID=31354 RepID=A0A7S1TEB4_9RHOD